MKPSTPVMVDNHNVYFTHPPTQAMMKSADLSKQFQSDKRPCIQSDGSLMVPTGANQITWGYGLNTVTYPTYGGEVVQILSAYITDLTIGGDVQSYDMMEDIYVWFLVYMSIATQGAGAGGVKSGVTSYNEESVAMWYPHREWAFRLRPKALPGLHMGREVVAPTWAMTAAVIEADPEAEAFTLKGAMEGLKEIQAGVGYEEENPFSSPSGKAYDSEYVKTQTSKMTDWYGKVISAYENGDTSSLDIKGIDVGSSPTTATPTGKNAPDSQETASQPGSGPTVASSTPQP